MIVSRSADYALRAMVFLARLDSRRYVPANEIAYEMQTPPFLLSRILQQLVKGELLDSMKGHHGGFKLHRAPETISVFEVIHCVDGPMVVHDCASNCGLSYDCHLKEVFARVGKSLEASLTKVRLADLVPPRRCTMGMRRKNGVRLQESLPGVE